MGVKDLWSILAPVCDRKPLWELQDKAVAIDLSCWVCDSQNVEHHNVQPRMYLRNLFFRTSCLLLLGVKPLFVLEGIAPALKHNTMARRNRRQHTKHSSQPAAVTKSGKGGGRGHFRSVLKQCEELLSIMGVSCVQGEGEAEATCARLNNAGCVAGCITQDGDCFLYGAQTVYRNFTISHQGSGSASAFSVDVYKMSEIEERLSLSRKKLIALSMLCGCDYDEKGVVGVGKETAMKFIGSLDDDQVLDRSASALKRWRSDPYFTSLEFQLEAMSRKDLCERCGHTGRRAFHDKKGCGLCGQSLGCLEDKTGLRGMTLEDRKVVSLELGIRKKALQDPKFPSQDMMDEFLRTRDMPQVDMTWSQPKILDFIVRPGRLNYLLFIKGERWAEKTGRYSVRLLSWTEDYALDKFLPLLTRWHLLHAAKTSNHHQLVSALSIVRKRVQRGVACLEVVWDDVGGWLSNVALERKGDEVMLVTVEPRELLERAYPCLIEDFERGKQAKSIKGKSRIKHGKKNIKKENDISAKDSCGCKGNDGSGMLKHQKHLCQYLKPAPLDSGANNIHDLLENLYIDVQNLPRVKPLTTQLDKPNKQKVKRIGKKNEPKVQFKTLLGKLNMNLVSKEVGCSTQTPASVNSIDKYCLKGRETQPVGKSAHIRNKGNVYKCSPRSGQSCFNKDKENVDPNFNEDSMVDECCECCDDDIMDLTSIVESIVSRTNHNDTSALGDDRTAIPARVDVPKASSTCTHVLSKNSDKHKNSSDISVCSSFVSPSSDGKPSSSSGVFSGKEEDSSDEEFRYVPLYERVLALQKKEMFGSALPSHQMLDQGSSHTSLGNDLSTSTLSSIETNCHGDTQNNNITFYQRLDDSTQNQDRESESNHFSFQSSASRETQGSLPENIANMSSKHFFSRSSNFGVLQTPECAGYAENINFSLGESFLLKTLDHSFLE
uniref:Flap endonuclease GEN-like 1 n=1 Tax=Timema monikensis TaxID=170555 RepID=A0A7R9DY80_9NEOP|nr:unnamed protein product [Timema monikensis]